MREFHENEDVDIDFVYNLAYFKAAEIEQIQSHFLLILEYVLNHVEESIATIPRLTEAEQQHRKSSEFQDLLGIEYICVDNACSRGYRYDEPVLNGIEIDKDGQIQGVGEIKSSSMF